MADAALGERLERLTGTESVCCVPAYRTLARKIRGGARFPRALRQAKALADEHRLLAVALLKGRGELCACEIQAATGLSHATVSHHMAVLVDAGLVNARRDGKWTNYRYQGEEEAVP
jgi:ArsR family transcriptional regulator